MGSRALPLSRRALGPYRVIRRKLRDRGREPPWKYP
jgi:hypothetical protein